MLAITNTPEEIKEQVPHVEKLSIEQQLQLASANIRGTLESSLTAAAVATVGARMVQLDPDDQRDLFDCVKDLSTIKSREDAEETMKTILEILEPKGKGSNSLKDSLVEAVPSRQKHESWLIWISQKLRSLREDRGLTQEELANMAGLPQSHISRLEAGRHSPSMKTLQKLASALKVDVNSLSLLST